jgi:hypothetical protein
VSGTAPCPAFCACCAPDSPAAPALVFNRPGLDAITWRTGTYATYRQAMIEAIGTGSRNPADADDSTWIADTRSALSGLTTRDDADYAIMLVDLFAAVSDVLGFYSERYANEFFLRTAAQRDSLVRLVRLIGYQPSPGVAASAALAFLLDPGASVKVRAGLKVMSVPGQDEQPQTFETIGAIDADARLNDLPLFGAPQSVAPFAQGRARIPILARPNPLLRNDRLAIVGNDALEINGVTSLDTMPDGDYLSLGSPVTVAGSGSVGFRLLRELRLFGHDLPSSYAFYQANPAIAPALRWITKVPPFNLAAGQARYALDAKVDDLKTGALLLIDLGAGAPRYVFAFVDAIEADVAAIEPLSATVSWLTLRRVAPVAGSGAFTPVPGGLPAIADLRKTRVFELAPAAIVPRSYVYPDAVSGSTVYVRSDHLDDPDLLEKKRLIAMSAGGERRQAMLTSVVRLGVGSDGIAHIGIGFSPALDPLVAPRGNFNVAPASHGETQPDETLGHGDSGKAFQRFQLQRKPLTRLASASGIAPRAEVAVRVNGELWNEAPSLFGAGPTDRVYTLRTGDDGATVVGFGDGVTGARLPSGASNIVARYRTGLGLAGRVRGGQLATLLERPVGLRAVANPFPADGGVDPEVIGDARTRAPATVRTLGRAIALQDFEDVACQTGLVARARASWGWIGAERAIQLTVAGDGGTRLSPDTMSLLHAALDSARDPNHALILDHLWRVPIAIEAHVMRDPAYEADAVAAAAMQALTDALSFTNLPLGHALHLSQVVAAIQSATGVIAVDLDRFQIKGSSGWSAADLARRAATADPLQPFIRLFDARPRPPASDLDPLALAGLALDPDVLALPAEQAYVAAPATDIVLTVVDAL